MQTFGASPQNLELAERVESTLSAADGLRFWVGVDLDMKARYLKGFGAACQKLREEADVDDEP